MTSLVEFQKGTIWLKEYPVHYAASKFHSRMTIVRLASGNLFIHSPCEIDEQTAEEIKSLGHVEFIIAPSNFHYGHVTSAQKAFPDAETFICPGIENKDASIHFDHVLTDKPDSRLSKDFEQVLVRGSEIMWEVAFFHKATKTLILVDLIENFTDKTSGVNWSLKFWWKIIFYMWNQPKPAPEYQFGWKNIDVARESLTSILKWNFEKIILSHGDLIEANAKNIATTSWKRVLS